MTGASYALFGPAVAVGWALREFEVLGSDAPPEGLTSSALKQDLYQTSRTRKSTNKSTILDNQNILDGVKHTTYTDAKIAAIEELNAGSSESVVLGAATKAIDSYETTVKTNLLKSWNEAVSEFMSMISAVESHPDLTTNNVFVPYNIGGTNYYPTYTEVIKTHTMPDGTNFDIKRVNNNINSSNTVEFDPTATTEVSGMDSGNSLPDFTVTFDLVDYGQVTYLSAGPTWNPLWNNMDTAFQNVRDGISTWVTNVYSDVQSGEIEISDLVTPKERAAMMATEEGINQAIADLIALNIPVDPEREATITMSDTGATISGMFALTDSSDGPLEAGQSYDPTTFSGDVYFTADMSLVEGEWSAYQTGVDGGNITLTEDPYDGTAVEVETTANETVTVDSGNWTATGNGTWYYDASADLETDITEVASARFLSTSTDTNFQTFQITGTFTVDKLVNKQTGEEAGSTTFENSAPQDDTNYITQAEWDDLEAQNQQLIEKFENSQSGGGVDLGAFDMFGIPGEMVVIGAAALTALGVLSK